MHELVGLLRVEVDLVVWVRIVSVGHVDVVRWIRRQSVGQEGHGVDQQGDPEVLGRQPGPQERVQQGSRAPQLTLKKHKKTQV